MATPARELPSLSDPIVDKLAFPNRKLSTVELADALAANEEKRRDIQAKIDTLNIKELDDLKNRMSRIKAHLQTLEDTCGVDGIVIIGKESIDVRMLIRIADGKQV
tara:strand:+ start:1675 stop:1992 length:318 start_codon:yes stop_codon:yes gene_type:complete